MEKSKAFLAGVLIIILVFGMTFTGCATSHHHIVISNVRDISAVFIRNAGTTGWGSNMVSRMQNIHKSEYSERVDIRVIDSNGIEYISLNVAFDDNAFTETGKNSYVGRGTTMLLGILGAAIAIPIIIYF